MSGRSGRAAALAALAVLGGPLLAGCGIRGTNVPVDAGAAPTRVSCSVPDSSRPSAPPPVPSAPSSAPPAASASPAASAASATPAATPSPSAAAATVEIYLVCSQRVSPVPRTLPGPFTDRLATAGALLTELERRPDPAEDRAGFASEVPGGLAVGGPVGGDPAETLRLNQAPQELPSYALAQLVCTFAGTAAGTADRSVVLGGPTQAEPPRRYRCDDELRTSPYAGATAGTKLP